MAAVAVIEHEVADGDIVGDVGQLGHPLWRVEDHLGALEAVAGAWLAVHEERDISDGEGRCEEARGRSSKYLDDATEELSLQWRNREARQQQPETTRSTRYKRQ